ncbi:hypothetical protein ABFS82_14G065100 [Erythranthe guttata]|uniref:Uncharacterized protein n=1 Tax=Erythranthe guttata TaxID=4155 RepID=A0A022S318_ERYGU|nr:PREDICTED: uncharacterized protein LOC105960275 [Erythranthe guttata]EYU45675.1 hypothetical protein MIMGU_mgv1a013258mg [Erythranthe guttata]|eukprot:XP_012839898.1 PREDICTED: uncharacterized protein LOC105960275 [Erythranthe guttata]
MVSRGSSGDGSKVSKLHDRDSEIEKHPPATKKSKYPPPETKKSKYPPPATKKSKYPPPATKKSKYPPPETKKNPPELKNFKYTETKKRINRIRRQLQKLELDFKDNNRINKIHKQINKLEDKDFSETYTIIYERDSTTHKNPNNPKIKRDVSEAARLAMGYFSQTCSTRYYVADVIRATEYMCSGRVLCLTFTARPAGSQNAQTFKAEIYYGPGAADVNFVHLVDT